MSEGYPARYWWVVLVLVPLVGALIAVLPSFFGGGGDPTPSNTITITGSDVGGDVQIVENQVLIEQLVTSGLGDEQVEELKTLIIQAQALEGSAMYEAAAERMNRVVAVAPSAAAYNNLGVLRLREGRDAEALAAFEAGLALDSGFEPLQLNAARVHLRQGNAAEAIAGLATAGDSASVRALRKQVTESVASGAVEREPNDDRLQPNFLSLEQWVQARLSGSQDQDVFLFTTEAVPRDYVAVELDNRDSAFKYIMRVYAEDKRELASFTASTAGQDGELLFSALPGSRYLVSVSAYYSGGGSYRLRAVHRRRYDSFEPNDVLSQARALESFEPLNAALMDGQDRDFFALPESTGRLTVHVTNESQELATVATLYSPQQRALGSVTSENPGHDLTLSHQLDEPGTYYLSIVPYYSPGGSYRLDFTLEP